MSESSGYQVLHGKLLLFVERLRKLDHESAAKIIEDAAEYYGGGMPSEFLGESRIALEKVLSTSVDLPNELRESMKGVVAKITRGFHDVGGS